MKHTPEDKKSQFPQPAFFKFPRTIYTSGLLAVLTKIEIDIYNAIGCSSDFNSGWCRDSRETFRGLTGHALSRISTATKRLEAYGLIEKKLVPFGKGKPQKYRMTYKVISDPNIKFVTKPQTEDKYRHHFREKDGKWTPRYGKRTSHTKPQKRTSHTKPQKRSTKLDNMREYEKTPITPLSSHQDSKNDRKKSPSSHPKKQKKTEKTSQRKGNIVCDVNIEDTVKLVTEKLTSGLQRAKKPILPVEAGEKAFFSFTSSIQEYEEQKDEKK